MIFQDLKYALRSLWHSKGFAVVALLCLGFGIGLTSTIFSIVDGVLLKPFPYHEPERLVMTQTRNRPQGADGANVSYPDLTDWISSNRTFSDIGGLQGRSLTIADGAGEPERYIGALVTWNLFPMLGVQPILGQQFKPEDDRPGGGGVVMLSYAVWANRYHSDRAVIGRQILVNAVPSVVVGVMPPGFAFPENQKLWIPLTPFVAKNTRAQRAIFALGRLKPGVTMDQAQADLSAVMAQLATQYPDTNKDWDADVHTMRSEFIPADVTRVIWLMMAAVTLVLFIACSNVANLQLARATARRREISVRAALGAARRRIVTQLLTESVVLSLISVPLGILLAEVGTRLIASAMPPDQVPYYIHWEVDWRSVTFTLVIAITTAVLFGLFPALQASRGDLHSDLKEGTRGNSARRSLLRSGLVVSQVALALVALVGALLFVRTFINLNTYDVGFDTKPLLTLRFYMPGTAYEAADAKARRAQDIVERIERLPGVAAAFASNLVPASGGGGGGSVIIDGRPNPPGREPGIAFTGVTPHFYRALGVKMSEGRDFTDAEGWSRTPVVIVNDTMAKRFWKDGGAVGARFRLTDALIGDDQATWYTVIGVAPDIQQNQIDPEDRPMSAAYVPYIYQQTLNTGLTIRVSGAPATFTAAVRSEIRSADPNLPVFQVATMEDVRRLGFWQYALFGWIFGTTGVVGLLLASIGVYGVLAYAVTQRTPEIGVRVALGASRGDVIKLVVAHGMWLAGIGVVLGLALSAAGMPSARSLLYNVSPFDPLTFSVVAIFLLMVAFVASYLPALRATRVDPLVALREN